VSEIIKALIDEEGLDNTTLLVDVTGNKILIPKDRLEKGDKVSLVYNEVNTSAQEAILLSVNHPNLYKNLTIEVEFDFVKAVEEYSQQIEVLARAINTQDKTYTVDEYYAFGIQDESFYFAKIGYHSDGSNSFPYKSLFNLNSSEEVVVNLKQFNDEQKKNLFLSSHKLEYNNKYKLLCTIQDNLVSMKIKNTSLIESFETNYQWITLFENVNIDQSQEVISRRTIDLLNTISVTEKTSVIDGNGFFGLAVPSSHVRLYRYEVTPLDKNIDYKKYNSEEYSREVCTDFSNFYRAKNDLRLNSSDSFSETKRDVQEFIARKENYIELNTPVKLNDIDYVQFNNLIVEKDKNYEDKFVDVLSPMTVYHEGSTLKAFIDPDDTTSFGQKDEYFELEQKTDGVSYQFDVPETVFEKLLYPNSYVMHVLLEADKEIIFNKFDEVGLQKNPSKFITEQTLQEQYNGRKFFMETEFRRDKRIFEMGALGNGRFTYKIDDYFLNGNRSYESLWKYNLASFYDMIFKSYSGTLTVQTGISSTPITGFSLETKMVTQSPGVLWGSEEFSFMMASVNPEHIRAIAANPNMSEAELHQLERDGLSPVYATHITNLFKYAEAPYFPDLFLKLLERNVDYVSLLNQIIYAFGAPTSVGAEDLITNYQAFREVWLRDLDYNSHITTNGIENRNFYVSLIPKKAYIDKTAKALVFNETPKANKKIILRLFYTPTFVLARSYKTTDKFYRVPDNIKQLYERTERKKGVIGVVECFDPSKYSKIQLNDISFVVLPKNLNENNDNLFADLQLCNPFVEKTENVKRFVKAPLVKVEDILSRAFSETQLQDYTKLYPIPEEADPSLFFSISGQPLSGCTFFNELISGGGSPGSVVSEEIIDQYLNVSSWFNAFDNQFLPYYKRVLQAIVDVKTQNRYYTDKKIISTNTEQPSNIGNWFDGFYSGKRTPWIESISGEDFGLYNGDPWGTQNTRGQMYQQIKDTISEKFPDHDIYFVDLNKIINYEWYNIDNSITQGFDDPEQYNTPKLIDQILTDPRIAPKMADYVLGEDVLVSNVLSISGEEMYFEAENMEQATDDVDEYPLETRDSYGNQNKMTIELLDVVRPIQNGTDMFWKFNSSILFSSEKQSVLPEKVAVCAEYEYSQLDATKAKNFPKRVIQKVQLGISDGSDYQKFINPDVLFSKTVSNAIVHRVWLDNYKTTDVFLSSINGKQKIEFSNFPFQEGTSKDICLKYKASNYLDLRTSNIFLDNFNDKRDFFWYSLTRSDKGYLKTSNSYSGMITDSSILPGENIFKLSDMTLINGEYQLKTGGTNKAVSTMRVIQVGQDNEQIVSVNTLSRNNNFEISVDVYYDLDIERDLMQTDFIFKGNFKNIDGKQYFNEFYTLSLNAESSFLSLISRKIGDTGAFEEQILATLSKTNETIKRETFYTVKLKVIKDNFSVYFNERGKEEKFYFSFNLRSGYANTDSELVVSSLTNGLGVTYQNPKFYIDGSRMGLKVLSDKVYFSNMSVKMHEENNYTLGNALDVNNYDGIVSALQKQYNITKAFEKVRRTTDGYEYLQIGNSLFAKQSGGTFMKHAFYVEDFEVIGDTVYVQEKVASEVSFVVINVYKEQMKLVENIIVDGKGFIDEPIFSYLTDFQRVISKLEKVNDRLFITTRGVILHANTWTALGDGVWNEMSLIWDYYGNS
jgi:hypothetical protein